MSRVLLPIAIVGGIFGVYLSSSSRSAQPTQERVTAEASVRDFGAVGDGEADDTAAFQAAVDSGIGSLRIPAGHYVLTKSVEIDLSRTGPISLSGDGTARVIMNGPGPAFRVTGTHGGTAAPHTVKDDVWENERTPCLDGIEVEGAHPEADGFELSGTMQPILTRLSVRNARHGIVLTQRNRNVVIDLCHLYDNRGVGLLLDNLNLHQVNVTNCHISYNDAGGIVVRNSEIRNLQIGTCDIEGNMSPDTDPTANILIDASTSSVREVAIVGCTLQHNHTSPDSANIRCIGRSADENQKIGHMTISDNVLSDVAVNVHLQYCRGVIITGNTFWKGFQQNLLVEDSSDIVVGPNLMDRNPDYRPADSANTVVFRNCRDCTISGLHMNNALDGPALLLDGCSFVNVSNCTILDCPQVGISLLDSTTVRVTGCLIRADSQDAGIHVDGSDNILSNNIVRP